MAYLPPFLSEFPDSIVADCVPASGVMLANKITLGRYPASVAEREALQSAMGTQDVGADAAQLAAGLNVRYHLGLVAGAGWAGIAQRLADPGRGVAIFGAYQSLPPDVRQHSRQPGFVGGHCMYAQGDGPGTVTLGDPLASGYLPGVPITELEAFSAGLGGMFLGGQQQVQLVGYRATVGPGRVAFWRVVRFVHTLFDPKWTIWARGSSTPVGKGAPGFWGIPAPSYYAGRYLVQGKSGPFSVYAVYSDGSRRLVGSWS